MSKSSNQILDVSCRCLNPPTMASHLKASLMLSWWVLHTPLHNTCFCLNFWQDLIASLFKLKTMLPRFCTKSAIKWSQKAGVSKYLPSSPLSRYCHLNFNDCWFRFNVFFAECCPHFCQAEGQHWRLQGIHKSPHTLPHIVNLRFWWNRKTLN